MGVEYVYGECVVGVVGVYVEDYVEEGFGICCVVCFEFDFCLFEDFVSCFGVECVLGWSDFCGFGFFVGVYVVEEEKFVVFGVLWVEFDEFL